MIIATHKLPTTVAQLESFCIQVSHQGHAQAKIQLEGDDLIKVVSDEEEHKEEIT